MKFSHLRIRHTVGWFDVVRNQWKGGLVLWVGLACLMAVHLGGVSLAQADALQNWTARQELPPEWGKSHWDVTYGNGIFVAVGYGNGDFGTIYTSPDGTTWTAQHETGDPWIISSKFYGELRRVIFADGKFMTVGWSYARYISQDGTNWTGGIVGGLGTGLEEGFRDVCFGQGKYVAIDGGSSFKRILTSSDGGVTWQRQAPAGNPRRIGYGKGRFVVLGEQNGGVSTPFYWSSNGNNWFSVQIDFALSPSGLTWGSGMFVAVGNKSGGTPMPTILTSPDGASWTPQDPGVTNLLSSVECINGLFVATGDSVVLTSTNGINWESQAISNKVSRFTYGNGTLVGISGHRTFPSSGYPVSYWGNNLLQSEPLLQLSVTRQNPSALNVSGIAARTIQIESAGDAGGPWQVLETFPLTTSPYLWTDATTPLPPQRFYRATWVP